MLIPQVSEFLKWQKMRHKNCFIFSRAGMNIIYVMYNTWLKSVAVVFRCKKIIFPPTRTRNNIFFKVFCVMFALVSLFLNDHVTVWSYILSGCKPEDHISLYKTCNTTTIIFTYALEILFKSQDCFTQASREAHGSDWSHNTSLFSALSCLTLLSAV